MKKLSFLFLSLLLSFVLISCSSSSLPSTSEGDVPEWYLNPPKDPNYFYVASTATSRDMQLAFDKATADARAELARKVGVTVDDIVKKFSEEIGTEENSQLLQQFTTATKQVTSQTISGTNVSKKHIVKSGSNWRAYVLLEYPLGAANQMILQQIKQNEEMYTRFRATQTFQELEREVEKLKNK